MMQFLSTIFGQYAMYFIVGAQEVITLMIYMIVLTWYKEKRRFYPLRLVLAFIVQLGLCILLSMMRTQHNTLAIQIVFGVVILLMPLGTLFLCYREKVSEIFLCYTSVVAVKNASGTFFSLLLNTCGVDDAESISFFSNHNEVLDWAIYYGVHIVLLVLIYLAIRKGERTRGEPLKLTGATILAASAFVMSGIISPITRYYQGTSFPLMVCVKVLCLIIYMLIIAIRAGLLSQNKIKQELKTTEQLLKQEKRHYDEIRDSVELINMKCHDIKKQLSSLQGKLTENEIAVLQEAVKIYDGNIKTGSDILDTILYQKSLYCEKNGIRLSCLADGSLLAFITPSELYALLSNALDNAIEAVMKLDEKMRVISITVYKSDEDVITEVTNYFDETEVISSGTSKADKAHHGYGIKSMQYIAEQYGGKIDILKEDNIFTLEISIPLPKNI